MQIHDLEMANDLWEMYNRDIIEAGEEFVCPVCSKRYKTKKGAESHLAKKNCAKAVDVFSGTLVEEDGLALFCELTGARGMSVFRKSKLYPSITQFIAFCFLNKIDEVGLYLSFVMAERDEKETIMASLKWAANEKFLVKFRKFIHDNPEYTEDYFKRNRDELLNDEKYLVKSVELARVSINHILDDEELNEKIKTMPIAYFERMMRAVD